MFRRLALISVFLGSLFAASHRLAAQGANEVKLTGEKMTADLRTGEAVYSGNAKLSYGPLMLTADEMRFTKKTGLVTAKGRFVLSRGGQRMVADEGTYNVNTGHMIVRNLRLGQFPIYLTGESVEGTLDELVFENATIFLRDNAAYAPSIKAKRIVYQRGKIVSGEGLGIGLLGRHFISLPRFEHDLTKELISYLTARAGYRRSLGAFVEAGVRVPVSHGFKAGGDVGLYLDRGLMFGPGASYDRVNEDGSGFTRGALRSGYINDHGEKLRDILGRFVPEERGYIEWWHRQAIGPRLTIDGQFNYWSDSEIIRDFRPKRFFPVQQPDSFLEAAYHGENYLLSAFLRVHPNRYHRVQERLPEIRFDWLPSALPGGFYHRLSAGFALLEEDAFLNFPQERSTRLDAYYGIERPFAATPWLTITPVAGGRVTHYARANGNRDSFTRTIGEIGFDARLRASGTFEYKNEVWEIDGLRHLVEPRISYRYAPEAGDGRQWIPSIDRRVFNTYLQPLSIADTRQVDDLTRLDTMRFALHNTLQTRDEELGSRDLATLAIAADYRFARQPGQRHLSDLHVELALMPAPWVRFEVYERFLPQSRIQQELNYAVEFTDQEWWAARLSSHFLKNEYEEYSLDYRQRINEVFDVIARLRYDSKRDRFNEQSYGLWQRLGQTWAIKYEVSLFEGRTRESSFGFDVEIELLEF